MQSKGEMCACELIAWYPSNTTFQSRHGMYPRRLRLHLLQQATSLAVFRPFIFWANVASCAYLQMSTRLRKITKDRFYVERFPRSWEVPISFQASKAMMYLPRSLQYIRPSLMAMYGIFIFRNSWTFLETSNNRLKHPENISIREMRNWRPGELGNK